MHASAFSGFWNACKEALEITTSTAYTKKRPNWRYVPQSTPGPSPPINNSLDFPVSLQPLFDMSQDRVYSGVVRRQRDRCEGGTVTYAVPSCLLKSLVFFHIVLSLPDIVTALFFRLGSKEAFSVTVQQRFVRLCKNIE